jgi:endonuclease-3 related protein
MQIYRRLYRAFGGQHWWPADSPFEVMVGAILTQNTSWRNVERAIANLRKRGLLSPQALEECDPGILRVLIRPAGYYNIKVRRLKNFVRWFCENYRGEVDRMRQQPLEVLRAQLLSVQGVGKETADSILLYALEKPIFVVDAYTHRVLERHELVDSEADYDMIQEMFHNALRSDVGLYKEYHALLVRVGKEFCRPRARCEGCPLEGWVQW